MSDSVKHKQGVTVALLTAIGLIIITILIVWKLKQYKCRFIHATGCAMLCGVVLGVIVKCLSSEDLKDVCSCVYLNRTHQNLTVDLTTHIHCHRHVGATWKHVSFPKNNGSCLVSTHYKETFDPEVLFILFLPPIIFHGAYTLNQRRFIGNLGSVLTFAFLGTVITCVVIGSCVYGFTRLMVLAGHAKDGDFPLTVCFLFGAIMSATDPVSVLSLFSELRVDPDVYTLLFGESVLNDAVAIALTRAITSYSPPPKDIGSHGIISDEIHAYFSSVGHFVGVFVGSFLLGFTFTVITALLTKFTRLRESPLLETSLLFLLSWSSFLSAEACNMSGIMAVLFCGLSQARYTVHNLSPEAKTRTKQLFEFFTFLGEIFIFGYMGYVWFTFPHHVFNVLFIVGAFLAVFISRACNVYPLCFLLNLGRTNKIPRNVQHLMMFAGLRGAVAFALAVGLHRGESADARRADAKRTIFTTALLLVCSTVWLLGAAAGPALSLLGIRVGVDVNEDPDECSFDQVTTERAVTQDSRPDTTQGLWHRLDYKYIMPVLTHCGPPLTSSLPGWCFPVARLFSNHPAFEDEEQLQETADSTPVEIEKTEGQQSDIGGGTEVDHHEDLLAGDLGLGTGPALTEESPLPPAYQSPTSPRARSASHT